MSPSHSTASRFDVTTVLGVAGESPGWGRSRRRLRSGVILRGPLQHAPDERDADGLGLQGQQVRCGRVVSDATEQRPLGETRARARCPRVLFLVNENTSLSGPLELTFFLASLDLDLHIAVFYEDTRSDYYAAGRAPADLPPSATVHWLQARRPFDPGATRRLNRLVRTLRPDIVHLHHTISSVLGATLAKAHSVPVIVRTEHNDHRRFKAHQNVLNAISLGCVDRVICNSDSTRHSLHWWEKGLAGSKAVTIHNGIDVGRVRERAAAGAKTLRAELGIPPDALVIGSIGRLIEQKDHATLLEAFARARHDGLDAYCVIVGGGKLEDRLRELSAKLGIEDRVRLPGNQARDRAYEFLGIIDVFVVASIWEGFCNAAVEAMAACVPLLCSDIETLHEVVGPGGSYFTPGSPAELADRLSDLAGMDDAARRELGQKGADWVLGRYQIEQTAQRYRDLYVDALHRRSDRRRGAGARLGRVSRRIGGRAGDDEETAERP